MRTLIIESCPSISRWAVECDGAIERGQSFRLWGRRNGHHGKWLWTDGQERLSAFGDDVISVADLWASLLDHDKVDRHEDASTLVSAIISEISGYANCDRYDRVVFIIPESLPETTQNALIASLSASCRIPQREIYLLWRSVALSLAEVVPPADSAPRIVLDYGHLVTEFTNLDIVHSDGYHCPVRDFTRIHGYGLKHTEAIDGWVAENYVHDGSIGSMRLEGFKSTAYGKLQADLNFDPPEAWKLTNNCYEPVDLAHDEFSVPIDWMDLSKSLESFLERISSRENANILWHGWPPFWHGEDVIRRHYPSSSLLEPDAILLGGVEFAKRHRRGIPTYFEVIPGYRIWCESGELGLPREWRWEELIPDAKILGTDNFKADPNEKFKLLRSTKSFHMNVRRGLSETYRFVEQMLPVEIEEETPIVIQSQIRPTGGGVKFSLRAKEHANLFGRNSELSLHWDRAEERPVRELEPPVEHVERYGYPFIIRSEGVASKRNSLDPIALKIRDGGKITDYLSQLDKIIPPIMRVNQFDIPFGNRAVTPHLTENLIHLLAEINNEAEWHVQNVSGADPQSWKWIRTLGGLFHYASESNQELLYHEVMRKDFPSSGYQVSALFWSFGRVCRQPEQLEQYLNRAISRWEHLAGMHHWVFWPFQKSLCCYGRSALISRATGFKVFECASQMLDWIINDCVPTVPGAFGKSNWKKWTLSAILFGLRLREVYPDFLSIETGPKVEQQLAIQLKEQLMIPKILLTKIPEFALKGIEVGDDEPRLGALVLKFLEARADAKDIALAGGIGLSS